MSPFSVSLLPVEQHSLPRLISVNTHCSLLGPTIIMKRGTYVTVCSKALYYMLQEASHNQKCCIQDIIFVAGSADSSIIEFQKLWARS